MITKMFGKSATSSGFTVNDVMPTDGIYNETYHSYTGYSADAARIADGDKVVLFFIKTEASMAIIIHSLTHPKRP